MSENSEPRIVAAVGIASGSGLSGKKGDRARKVEEAIAAEIQKCFDEGLANDQEQIKERMLKIRREVLDSLEAEEKLAAARDAVERAKENTAAATATYEKMLAEAAAEKAPSGE